MTQEVRPFILVQTVGGGQGFDIPDPVVLQMQMDRTSNYVDAIRNECRGRGFSLIISVLRSARGDTYSSNKKLTCAEFGIHSQVITGRNLKGQTGKLKSIAAKVMIQIALKLGAEPWRVLVPNTVTETSSDSIPQVSHSTPAHHDTRPPTSSDPNYFLAGTSRLYRQRQQPSSEKKVRACAFVVAGHQSTIVIIETSVNYVYV